MLNSLIIFLALSVLTQVAWAQCPNLVWADEFDGNTLNTDNWSYQIGDGCDINLCGWGNNELQSYQQANAVVANGELSITANSERVGNSNYSSARLRTINKVDFTYGRIESRIKLPSGGGLWPAFWMLPTDEVYGFWPQSGEIDIMEWVGNQKAQVFGTIHYGQPSPNNSSTGGTISSIGGDFGNEYHVFAVEWEANVIRWYIDDYLYSVKTRTHVSPQRWPFDQDFHLLLNMAVGGNFGGPVASGIFPATMKVDYVRLYDGNKPAIQGDRFLATTDRAGQFTISGIDSSTPVTWSGPSGITFTGGQGTPTVDVMWINEGGVLTAEVELPCGSQTMSIEIAPGVTRSASIENFDGQGLGTFDFCSGVLTEVANPNVDAVNDSPLTGMYVRDGASQYDVILYAVNSIGSANDFVSGQRQLYIDVYSDAAPGTEILVQLETRTSAPDNYPTGRHSRYQAYTTAETGWQRLQLEFVDRPDANANANDIVLVPILFEPGVLSGSTIYYDNLDIYSAAPTVGTSPEIEEGISISLRQNPVNSMATLDLALESTQTIQIELTNTMGQVIQSLNLGLISPGKQEIGLETGSITPGSYLVSVYANNKKMQSIFLVKQ